MDPWQARAATKREACLSLIPPEWILPTQEYPRAKDVRSIPTTCGLLSALELTITDEDDIEVLLRKVASSEWSAEDVARAYCKRSAIAQQLVRFPSVCSLGVTRYLTNFFFFFSPDRLRASQKRCMLERCRGRGNSTSIFARPGASLGRCTGCPFRSRNNLISRGSNPPWVCRIRLLVWGSLILFSQDSSLVSATSRKSPRSSSRCSSQWVPWSIAEPTFLRPSWYLQQKEVDLIGLLTSDL